MMIDIRRPRLGDCELCMQDGMAYRDWGMMIDISRPRLGDRELCKMCMEPKED